MKRKAITSERLYAILSGFSGHAIGNSFDLSGMENQTVTATFNNLPANIKCDFYTYTVDSKEKSVLRGSFNSLVTPDQTTIVNLDLSPEY